MKANKNKKIRVAINGFGRIGRAVFKAGFPMKELEFVAVNDLTDPETLAHLLKYDSVYGAYNQTVLGKNQPKKVSHVNSQGELVVDGKKLLVLAEKDPANLPWKDLEIDLVLECTGRFVTEEGAGAHLKAGAERVIISAPAKAGEVDTYIFGVNAQNYKGEKIISNASCTTNCIGPVVAVMEKKFGIKKSVMTTIHSYTADQNLVDGPHKDLRRARAAAGNIVPTTTGAAIALGEIIPQVKGKFDGLSVRVPTMCVSLSDITFLLNKKTTVEEVNQAFVIASHEPLWKGILGVSSEPLVSSDYVGNPLSAIVDLELTKVIDNDLVKVIAWYDNEWAYSLRLAELAVLIGKSVK